MYLIPLLQVRQGLFLHYPHFPALSDDTKYLLSSFTPLWCGTCPSWHDDCSSWLNLLFIPSEWASSKYIGLKLVLYQQELVLPAEGREPHKLLFKSKVKCYILDDKGYSPLAWGFESGSQNEHPKWKRHYTFLLVFVIFRMCNPEFSSVNALFLQV